MVGALSRTVNSRSLTTRNPDMVVRLLSPGAPATSSNPSIGLKKCCCSWALVLRAP
ncbi:Uncharacterised protein [Mycobacterium tuberculosis]|uniref:Uncharacterized protein n=1 Tax=Mycobacterium tuberculosis TaxID=1773 RepID=A0A0U0UPN3_MYCTX|nr:Uncharacterised protein [Mycobacterium tuberculosis]CPA43909.1 Uncharacterised protein [Mycobacterium tuberculosis]CPB06097.1 Uncharacterised protein [Mycobacterium tuberculosis]